MKAEALAPDVVRAFEQAIADYAREVVRARLYSGSEAIKAFGITRHCLSKIQPTRLEGGTRPMYSARAILRYLSNREGKP